jgi:hypothetical protein
VYFLETKIEEFTAAIKKKNFPENGKIVWAMVSHVCARCGVIL